jgi:hypothetical protein
MNLLPHISLATQCKFAQWELLLLSHIVLKRAHGILNNAKVRVPHVQLVAALLCNQVAMNCCGIKALIVTQ